MAKIKYENAKAIAYAKQYCGLNSNACGVYLDGPNKSDCAHFVAHALAAGGITVARANDEDALCPQNLTARNTVIEPKLKSLAAQFDNVHEIPLSDGIVGDVGFLQLHRPSHGFVVSRPGKYGAAGVPFVWAHSAQHCDSQLDTVWRQWFSSAYRLEDG